MLFDNPPPCRFISFSCEWFPFTQPEVLASLFSQSLGGFSSPSSSKLGAPVASLVPRAAGEGLGVLRAEGGQRVGLILPSQQGMGMAARELGPSVLGGVLTAAAPPLQLTSRAWSWALGDAEKP